MKTFSHSFIPTRVITCLSLLFLLVPQIHTHAQEVKIKKPYTAVVRFISGKNTKGILYKVNESSIELRTYPKSKKATIAIDSQIVEVSRIKSIVIRKGNASTGIISGIALGVSVAVVMASLAPDYQNKYIVNWIVGGALVGGAVGAAVTKGKKYIINGEQARYSQIGEKLKKRQIAPE